MDSEASLGHYRARRRIEFADTDMGGICHFSRYMVFLETAEHEWLRRLGADAVFEHEGRRLAWPRVSVALHYRAPARFGDELEIELRVRRVGRTSVTYACRVACAGREIVEGEMTAVCCALEPELAPVPIPEPLARRLRGE